MQRSTDRAVVPPAPAERLDAAVGTALDAGAGQSSATGCSEDSVAACSSTRDNKYRKSPRPVSSTSNRPRDTTRRREAQKRRTQGER